MGPLAAGSASDEVAGDVGYVVDADDTQAAARHIVTLAGDPTERAARSRAGVARAALYDATIMARGYLESYRRALRSGR